ncbi:MAG TPA: hypothetical protein VF487_02315 [Chitinophagaceae bacterium]
MKKSFLFVTLLFGSVIASAQDTAPKEDNSFKIVGVVSLLGALFLAVRSLRSTYKK